MTEAGRIKLSILVSDKIIILSIFVGCFYNKGPALKQLFLLDTQGHHQI